MMRQARINSLLRAGVKKGERIYIGDDIVITIAEINRHAVKIGISAPKNVSILREELVAKDSDSKDLPY